MTRGAHAPQHLESDQIVEHDIQDDQRRIVRLDQCERFAPARSEDHVEALEPQRRTDQKTDVLLVIYDENSKPSLGHPPSLVLPPARSMPTLWRFPGNGASAT